MTEETLPHALEALISSALLLVYRTSSIALVDVYIMHYRC